MNNNGRVSASKQQLGDLANLRHIKNLLSTVLSNLEAGVPTAHPQGIETIQINTTRALEAVNNELLRYYVITGDNTDDK